MQLTVHEWTSWAWLWSALNTCGFVRGVCGLVWEGACVGGGLCICVCVCLSLPASLPLYVCVRMRVCVLVCVFLSVCAVWRALTELVSGFQSAGHPVVWIRQQLSAIHTRNTYNSSATATVSTCTHEEGTTVWGGGRISWDMFVSLCLGNYLGCLWHYKDATKHIQELCITCTQQLPRIQQQKQQQWQQ